MKISIIIPIYNVSKFLPDCLDSIINQSYNNLEIICINDGSTDDSKNIILKYKEKDNRIILINQENKGLAGARNTGLKYATGKYVYFCDSDDWIDKDLIKHSYEQIQKYNSDLVIFDFNNVYDGLIVKVNRVSSFIQKYGHKVFNFNENKNIIYQNPSACAKLYKKSFLEQNNLYFPEDLRFGEDSPFWIKLLFCNPKITLLNEYLYFYRKREGGLTTKTTDFVERQWYVYTELKKVLKEKNASSENMLLALDFECRLAVYNYSAINNFSQFIPFEKSIKQFAKEYEYFKNCNLWGMKGYFLLKYRLPYMIGKKFVLKILKFRGKKNETK